MTPDEAEWVRTTVWTPGMRKTFHEVPAFHLQCACQHGATGHCRNGNHDQCTPHVPLPSNETYLLKRGGTHPAQFPEPYFHRSRTSRGGAFRNSHAEVWLADRVCRWRCPCTCHPPPPPRLTRPVQLDLFTPEHTP
ncbi:DUF6248 family natural product biosynthesis protein [Saccharothrix sp. HUAS TT1]|uniref:DUF6248 family natural product biosynthesis protein n=1 Tax=unclassified Saccharothrix TaxID=2593673 RepID=UPI00345BF7A9